MTKSPPHVAVTRARHVRSAFIQLALVAAFAACALWLFANVQANLQARNIASGFDFLSEPAGFAIGERPIDYAPTDSFGRALLVGLINTLKVSALAIVGATVLGFALGFARLSSNVLLRGVARGYVEFVRNVPLLLHLLVLYAVLLTSLPALPDVWQPIPGILLTNRGLALPGLTGDVPTLGRFNIEGGWQLSTELLTLVCGLALYSAAYIAEIVRAGILSVPVGQREAAASLGLSKAQSLRHVIVPQALRAMMPPLASWYLNTVKNSSLAVVVAYPDLVSIVDTLINQTGQAVEGVAIIVAAFLTINLFIAGLVNLYNARLLRAGPAAGVLSASSMVVGQNLSRGAFATRLVSELFGSVPRTIGSVALLALLGWAAITSIDWLLLSATFSGGSAECRIADGACWPFLAHNYRLILFGAYPLEEQWRAAAALVVFAALLAASFNIEWWGARLVTGWVGGVLAVLLLMRGGVFGLLPVPTEKWSGLPLTAVLASVAVLGALPLAVALALARRSHIAALRVLATGFIEVVRGTPLVAVLFMAALMFPLLLPPSFEIDSFARVQVALILFTAAYMAESVRAGLQALPHGQAEAAKSLGLSRLQSLRHVILPQAIRISIPGLVNTSISEVKNTTLVLIVGMFDLLQTTRLALVDVQWRPYYVEAYGFTATVFFIICFAISQLSLRLERSLGMSGVVAPAKEIA